MSTFYQKDYKDRMVLSLRKRREKSLITKLHKELQKTEVIPEEDTLERCMSAAVEGLDESADILAAYCKHIRAKTGWIIPLLLPFKQGVKMPSFSSIITLSPNSRKLNNLELEFLLDECKGIYTLPADLMSSHFVLFQIENVDESLVYCDIPPSRECVFRDIKSKFEFSIGEDQTRAIFSYSWLLKAFPFAKDNFTGKAV